MINKLDNFTMKSFKNYSGPIESFSKKNIVFGYNGRGKSSLAKGVYEKAIQSYDKGSIRIFNEQYIKENLILEDNNTKIKGVRANFGEKSVDIENKLKELKEQIQDESIHETEIETLTDMTRSLINNIHDKRKGNANITKKSSHLDLFKLIELYKNDFNSAKKIGGTEEELTNIKGDSTLENLLSDIKKLNIGKIESFSNRDDIEELIDILNTPYKEIQIPSSELIDWLNKGLKIHIEKTKCEFCKNPLNYDAIKNEITYYNENEIQKSRNFIINYQKYFKEYIDEIKKYVEKKEHVLSVVNDNHIKEIYKDIDSMKIELENFNELIDSKLSKFEEQISTDTKLASDLQRCITDIESKSEKIIEIIEDKEKELNLKYSNQDKLVKGGIAYEIINDNSIRKNLYEITNKKKELDEIKENNKSIEKEIIDLEHSKADVGDFANLLSKILEDLGIDIKVTIDNDRTSYILQHTRHENELTIDNISEGERNILSLLFFYYELFNDDLQNDFKDEIDLIILDDPISSLDGSNRYYVLELVKSILNLKDIQTFVLTHVWEDFTDLSYGKDKNKDYSLFEVYKNEEGNSTLRLMKSHESPYKMLFQEIYEFSKKNRDDILSHCDIYHLPNSIRRVFEEFLSFKSSKNIIPTGKNQKHIESIMNITSQKDKQKLSVLLTVCNVLSHKAMYNPEEVLNSAKFLMKLIKSEDEKHYHAMKGTN